MSDDRGRLAVCAVTFIAAEDARRAATEVRQHAGSATGTKAVAITGGWRSSRRSVRPGAP